MSSGLVFDFDDTLVETTVYYNDAKSRFSRIMDSIGFPAVEALETLNQFDIKHVQRCGGFLKQCFPFALVDTYEYYCRVFRREICNIIRNEIETLGWWVFDQPARPVQNAEEVLEQLYGRFPLFLATKGDRLLQMERVEQSGLSHWFKEVYVLADKNVVSYQQIAVEQRIMPGLSWMIGNSMKSDINPALKAGFNSIYIYHPHTWDYEDEAPLGGHVSAESLLDILDVVCRGNSLEKHSG